jgi:short-subunit dehydrogenase
VKTIVITGGSDGLGRALAENLSSENKVIILARHKAALDMVAGNTGAQWIACDVRDAKSVSSAFEQIDSIDVLINNAGVIVNGDLTETSDEIIENVITTNTLGSIYAAKAALKLMKSQKSGRIINVISQAGITAKANPSVYNASKWAMTGFTKALEEEAKAYGVLVTGFYPGTIRTDLFAKAGLEIKGPALSTDEAVSAIRYILSLSNNVAVPELGIKPAYRA